MPVVNTTQVDPDCKCICNGIDTDLAHPVCTGWEPFDREAYLSALWAEPDCLRMPDKLADQCSTLPICLPWMPGVDCTDST